MSNTSILVLGAGVMQLPALNTARRNGWHLIVADGNEHAVGKDLANAFHVVDLKDIDGLLELARGYKERGALDGVFTAGTDFSASVAYVAEHLGLPGLSYEAALNATDKARMRRVLAEAGVPSPGYRMVQSAEDTTVSEVPPFPLVVKPVDNMGARGVRRVEDHAQLLEAVSQAVQFSRSGRVIIEEYIDGPEFSIDALVVEGTLHVCGIADRHIRFPPHFIEVGHTIPTQLDERQQQEVAEVLEAAAAALGIHNGAAKGDMFMTDRGAVVGEVAARLSGGYMSGWTYPYASDVPLTEAAMRMALGMTPGDLSPRKHWTAAERASVSIPGTVSTVHGLDRSQAEPGLKELFQRAYPGDTVVFPRNNTEKCANAIAAAPERAEAVAAAEGAISELVFRLEPGSPETKEFLADETQPVAFRLSSPRNREALERMGEGSAKPGIRRYYPLPEPAAETEVDWNYRSLARTLEMLERLTGVRPAEATEESAHGSPLWRSILKGGLQGALFYLDTLDMGVSRW
ncbi:MAG: ATP-grasp domain-containing protein [Spirochaetota bacterium]